MKNIELAVWDYDGVIVDSFKDVHASYERLCNELGGKYYKDINEFKKHYNIPENHIKFLENLGISNDKHARADEIFNGEMAKKEPLLFEGVEETLRTVYNKRDMVIVSSGHRPEIINRLVDMEILHIFMDIFANRLNGVYFDKTEPIKTAIERYAKLGDNAIMIGDRNVDFFHAREAGIPAENIVLTDYGWGYNREKLQEQGYCLNTRVKKPLDILTAIEEIESK